MIVHNPEYLAYKDDRVTFPLRDTPLGTRVAIDELRVFGRFTRVIELVLQGHGVYILNRSPTCKYSPSPANAFYVQISHAPQGRSWTWISQEVWLSPGLRSPDAYHDLMDVFARDLEPWTAAVPAIKATIMEMLLEGA